MIHVAKKEIKRIIILMGMQKILRRPVKYVHQKIMLIVSILAKFIAKS